MHPIAVQSAHVLRYLAAAGPASLAAIAEGTGKDKANTRRSVLALEREGFVDKGDKIANTEAGRRAITALDVAEGKILIPEGFVGILFEDLLPDPDNARKNFDPASLEELAADIEARGGLLQNLIVRPRDADGFHYLRGGERRRRAVGLLIERGAWPKTRPLVCQIRQELGEAEHIIEGLVENLQRDALPPIDEARQFKRLLGLGLDTDDVAGKVNKSRRYVQLRLNLLNLPWKVQEAIAKGEATAEDGKRLVRFFKANEEIKEKVERGEIDVDEVVELAKDAGGDDEVAEVTELAKTFTASLAAMGDAIHAHEAAQAAHGDGSAEEVATREARREAVAAWSRASKAVDQAAKSSKPSNTSAAVPLALKGRTPKPPPPPTREETVNGIMAAYPNDRALLVGLAEAAVKAYNAAVIDGDFEAVAAAGHRFEAAVWKLNGGTHFGCNTVANELHQQFAAPDGEVPNWGQAGRFVVELEDMRTVVVVLPRFGYTETHGFAYHALDFGKPYISNTGFRSSFVKVAEGQSVLEATLADLAAIRAQLKRGKLVSIDGDRAGKIGPHLWPWLGEAAPDETPELALVEDVKEGSGKDAQAYGAEARLTPAEALILVELGDRAGVGSDPLLERAEVAIGDMPASNLAQSKLIHLGLLGFAWKSQGNTALLTSHGVQWLRRRNLATTPETRSEILKLAARAVLGLPTAESLRVTDRYATSWLNARVTPAKVEEPEQDQLFDDHDEDQVAAEDPDTTPSTLGAADAGDFKILREYDPFHEIIKRLVPIGRTAIVALKNVEGGIVTHADIEAAREILAAFEPLIADAAQFVREEKAA